MIYWEKDVTLFWLSAKLYYIEYDEDDKVKRRGLFNSRKTLNQWLKDFQSRWANLPEWISEVAFCIAMWYVRYTKVKSLVKWQKINISFDTFNLNDNIAHQVKACSIDKDLTSFWPKSKWDELYFLDFYNNGTLDWSFDIYLVPNQYIYWNSVNASQTLQDQQAEKRRPRFSI